MKMPLDLSDDTAKEKSTLDTAVKIVSDLHVFIDEHGDPFVFVDGHCLPLKSRKVKAKIQRMIHAATKKSPKQSVLTEVIATLEGKAICEGKQIKLYLRMTSFPMWKQFRM